MLIEKGLRTLRIVILIATTSSMWACDSSDGIISDRQLMGSEPVKALPKDGFIFANQFPEGPVAALQLQENGSYLIALIEEDPDLFFITLHQFQEPNYVATLKRFDKSGFTYALLNINKNNIRAYVGEEGSKSGKEIAMRLGLNIAKYSDPDRGYVLTGGKDDLLKLMDFSLKQNQLTSIKESYTVKELTSVSDDFQNLYKSIMQVAHKKIETPSPSVQEERVKTTESGIWTYQEELDQITDEKKQFIFGVPTQHDGTQDQPYIRMGCYEKDMGITLYWGNILSDMYPHGEIDASRVTVRFDTMEPLTLGWMTSEDFTSTFPPSAGTGAIAGLGESILGAIVPGAQANFQWSPQNLSALMVLHEKMTVRAKNRRGGNTTIVFDLKGYDAIAVDNFKNHCRG